VTPAGKPDHRSGPRRRGEELESAIFEAALAELAEVGYHHLRMDQVARRARTGKTSLYRRWPTRADLVVEAIRDRPEFADFTAPDTGDVRADTLELLRRFATVLEGPFGEVLRGVVGELNNLSPELHAARERVMGFRQESLVDILRRGAQRGQVRADAVTDRLASLGMSLTVTHFLLRGAPVPDDVVVGIVDDVVMPLLRP
jgi:AcrR family transcriptional regulator